MRIVYAALWAVFFVVLFAFAVNNTAPTDLRLFAGMSVRAPLIALLLVFFVGGFVLGFVALMPTWIRQRVALRRLRRATPPVVEPSAPAPRGARPAGESAESIQTVARGARTTS